RQHRGRNEAQRAARERRGADAWRQQQEAGAQQVRDQRHADEHEPKAHGAFLSTSRPTAMPAAAAAITDRRKGSALAATTVTPAASAAAIIARSRSSGTDIAMKARGAANSRRQDAGTPAPMTIPASTAS